MPVTGPDGDNPISDEQIRVLLDEALSHWPEGEGEVVGEEWADLAEDATWALNGDGEARGRCAAAWNERHAEGER